MVFFWCASTFCTYLVSFGTKNIAGNVFLNIILTTISDIPLVALSSWVNHKFGLKISMFAFFLLSVVGGITVIIFSEVNTDVVPVFLAFAKGGV
jgi:hypothetical protein